MNTIRSALRIITAIIRRDTTLFFRYKTWFLGTFVFSLIMPFSFLYISRSLAGRNGEGLAHFQALSGTADYASFIIIGTIVWDFIGIILWSGGMAMQRERTMGLLEIQWSMPVSRYVYLCGTTISAIILSLVPIMYGFSVFRAFGLITISGNILEVLAILALTTPLFIGIMLLFAVITLYLREAGELVGIIQTVLTVVCGIQIPLASLPLSVQHFSSWFPLTVSMNLVRSVLIQGTGLLAHKQQVAYLFCSGMLLFFTGTILFVLLEKRLRRRGALTGF